MDFAPKFEIIKKIYVQLIYFVKSFYDVSHGIEKSYAISGKGYTCRSDIPDYSKFNFKYVIGVSTLYI
jgi:hypothetical protein